MKTAKETIYNFSGNTKDLAEETRKSILFWKEKGLDVDAIEITYTDSGNGFQSDPDEGNLPTK
jgi:hypothetical protein